MRGGERGGRGMIEGRNIENEKLERKRKRDKKIGLELVAVERREKTGRNQYKQSKGEAKKIKRKIF